MYAGYLFDVLIPVAKQKANKREMVLLISIKITFN